MFKLLDMRMMARPIFALTVCTVALTSAIAPANAENPIKVDLDYARIIKLDRPVSRVIVGNAEIADATVSDAQTIILTGKSFGTTNLVILDKDGNAIVDERVLVSLEEHNTLQIYRQVERTVMSCTPACEPLELE